MDKSILSSIAEALARGETTSVIPPTAKTYDDFILVQGDLNDDFKVCIEKANKHQKMFSSKGKLPPIIRFDEYLCELLTDKGHCDCGFPDCPTTEYRRKIVEKLLENRGLIVGLWGGTQDDDHLAAAMIAIVQKVNHPENTLGFADVQHQVLTEYGLIPIDDAFPNGKKDIEEIG